MYTTKSAKRDGEVISMGMQRMWNDPIGFADNDPEYFDLMWRLMYDPSDLVH